MVFTICFFRQEKQREGNTAKLWKLRSEFGKLKKMHVNQE